MLVWSALAFLIAIPVIYLPVLVATKTALGGYQPILCFPIVATLIGLIPTSLIVFRWGGGIRGLFSPEASLFYILFAAGGIVVGLGYAWPRNVRGIENG